MSTTSLKNRSILSRLPKQLKIGGHLYRINYVHTPEALEIATVGLKNARTGEITIDIDQIDSEVWTTLIHEIFHVINGELKEELVDSLAQQVFQVIQDNFKGFT